MKFVNSTIIACLIPAVLCYPSLLNENADIIIPSEPFIGPPTRDQRLADGWIDEAAKYFRKFLSLSVILQLSLTDIP
jgi:hypothetical protein